MNKREEYELILKKLKSAQNEQEVIDNLTKIIKGYTSDFYKSDLYENSYFKSLLFEIKDDIYKELIQIKSTLNEEMTAINNEISKLNDDGITSIYDTNISKLRQLKKDCILLIKELDDRLNDLHQLN